MAEKVRKEAVSVKGFCRAAALAAAVAAAVAAVRGLAVLRRSKW